jgi:tetratricopeptide (TPR) repeat protein
MDEYFSLGTYERQITASSAEAVTWFNRGLIWCYGFHHKEALHCFEQVLELDPSCAMGHWGVAYATGPYYNIPWPKMSPPGREAALLKTYEHSQKAQSLSASCAVSPVERALCEALTCRFQAPQVEDDEVLSQWDDDYADAMRGVLAQFPHDNDICAHTAEALMCRTPWQLWDLENRCPAQGSDTTEAIGIIEQALARVSESGQAAHPGLLHFYIHIMEMSPQPEKALPASYALQHLVPDAGHLIHMPSHIYILCGEYEKTIEANIEAVEADDKYIAVDGALGIYTIYRLHNFHFQVYGALFSGQYEPALRAANQMQATVKPEHLLAGHAFLVNYLEAFYGMKAHVYIRFGKWQEILDEPLPADPQAFCVTNAFWHYAKGIAHSVLGDIENALVEQRLLGEAVAQLPSERVIFHNESRDIMAVAQAMLAGELEYRRENYDVAFGHLRRSVDLYDNLNYSEPWSWMQPPRHALGALLLEQGHVEEAARTYRADLGLDDTLVRPSQHPNNIWSLLGYAECCKSLGDADALTSIQPHLEAAQRVADKSINVSCFCRTVDECCS